MSGSKLRKAVYDNGVVITTVDYVNGVQYKNGKMDFFFTEQGRVKKLANGNLRYEYDIKDHLGNTRISFADTNSDGQADILQEDHYYAFGSRIEGLSTSSPNNKFTYNGKELEDDHGLNWYHYGARYYDPALGRWHAVDPVDEYQTPYAYVGNKPLIAIDPDGKDTWFIHGTGSNNDKWMEDAVGNWCSVFGERIDQGRKFDWSAESFYKSNQTYTREGAALNLANELLAYNKANGGPINIIAHSHGGNVAIMAANILKENGAKVDNLIIIGTPNNGTTLSEGAADMFISIYSDNDWVQVLGNDWLNIIGPVYGAGIGELGPAERKHQGAFNLNVTDIEGVNGHSSMDQNPWVINAISKFINVLKGNE